MRFAFAGTLAVLVLLVAAVFSTLRAKAEATGKGVPVHLEHVELEDQFGTPYHHPFPACKPMLLLAADKKAYPALEPWIETLRARWKGEVIIVGVADLRGVPRFLRNKVRNRFASAEAHPVLLDWEGDVLSVLQPSKSLPNAFLISAQGVLLLHLSGEATEAKLGTLQARLDALAGVGGTDEAQARIIGSVD